MDIERIYREALASGNHATALRAVFHAGVVSTATPSVDAPPAVEQSVPYTAPSIKEVAKEIEKYTPFWHPV